MVRLNVDGLDVLVSERRDQILDAAVFRLHGIEPIDYRIVAVKSSIHFQAGFDDIAKRFYFASGDGITTGDFRKFRYTRIERPLWPLDDPATQAFPTFIASTRRFGDLREERG
jgi:microcystin degradation protein MlrC